MGLVLMERLPQDLNYLLCLVEISAANQVNDDVVGTQDGLTEGLGLAIALNDLDLLIGRGHRIGVSRDDRTRELVRLLAGAEGHMVVTHLLEESVADQAVNARDEDPLALLGLGQLDRASPLLT